MIKILVLGSTGMAGHMITKYLEKDERYNVANISSKRKLNEKTIILDVTNLNFFDQFLSNHCYDVIINCIGILNEEAEVVKDKAILLNGYLPHYLESKFRGTNTKIIHLSTDCVFSGKKGKYIETAMKDGVSFYSLTKNIGEITGGRNLTFRTSIIGPDMNNNGIGLFNWFMHSKGTVHGYINSIWSGITTLELAKSISMAIEKDLSGLYHIVSSNPISKYDLLVLFKKIFNKEDIFIERYQNKLDNKSLVNTRNDFDFVVSSYEKMLVEMRDWINENIELYKHYF